MERVAGSEAQETRTLDKPNGELSPGLDAELRIRS